MWKIANWEQYRHGVTGKMGFVQLPVKLANDGFMALGEVIEATMRMSEWGSEWPMPLSNRKMAMLNAVRLLPVATTGRKEIEKVLRSTNIPGHAVKETDARWVVKRRRAVIPINGYLAAAMGVWHALLYMAADTNGKGNGTLLNRKGTPAELSHISRRTGYPREVLSTVMAWLEQVGWVLALTEEAETVGEKSSHADGADAERGKEILPVGRKSSHIWWERKAPR